MVLSPRIGRSLGLKPTMIGFDAVVGVLLGDMACGRNGLVDHPRVNRRPIGGDLDWRRASAQGAGKERPRGRAVAALADQDVDNLPVRHCCVDPG
jgi:hypothetical protein